MDPQNRSQKWNFKSWVKVELDPSKNGSSEDEKRKMDSSDGKGASSVKIGLFFIFGTEMLWDEASDMRVGGTEIVGSFGIT